MSEYPKDVPVYGPRTADVRATPDTTAPAAPAPTLAERIRGLKMDCDNLMRHVDELQAQLSAARAELAKARKEPNDPKTS